MHYILQSLGRLIRFKGIPYVPREAGVFHDFIAGFVLYSAEWAGCQRVGISPDTHRVPYHISFGSRGSGARQRLVKMMMLPFRYSLPCCLITDWFHDRMFFGSIHCSPEIFAHLQILYLVFADILIQGSDLCTENKSKCEFAPLV